jgi:hypothetical protein
LFSVGLSGAEHIKLLPCGITIVIHRLYNCNAKREDKRSPGISGMLEILDIAGKTITADAMHCQKETCKKIINRGDDYVFGLKENQKSLYEDIRTYPQ